MKEHQILTLVDSRDNNKYRVSKLKDGKCWMIDNLRIINKSITSADSNVEDTYTIPASDISPFKTTSSNSTNEAAYLNEAYGGYYTWQVVTAGTGDEYGAQGLNAKNSICPKGWRMPTSGPIGEFYTLNSAYGGATDSTSHIVASPVPGFVPSGAIYHITGAYTGAGSWAYYWSSTSCGTRSGYSFHFNNSSGGVDPSPCLERAYGLPVRCITE